MSRRALLACGVAASFLSKTLADDGRSLATSDSILAEWATVAPQSGAEQTRLRISASGLIESWPAGAGPSQREQRRPEEVKQLVVVMADSVRDNKLSSESILRELREESRRSGLSFEIRGADDTLLTLATETGRVEIRCPAPPLLAERFPNAAHLQSFVRLERSLANLHCVVQCGGQEAARSLCAQANERLLADHPQATAWTIDDLMMVRVSRDGGRFAQFRRETTASEFWTTCVADQPGRASRVTVIPPASLVR